MYGHTYKFLNDSDQIYASHYGFRSKHSCEHNIQELIGNILKDYEFNKNTLAVFLDQILAKPLILFLILFCSISLKPMEYMAYV